MRERSMRPALWLLTVALLVPWTGPSYAAEAFPLFQSQLIDVSGKVLFQATVEGKTISREAGKNEPWLQGETLKVDDDSGSQARVAIADLGIIAFSGGSSAKLVEGTGTPGTVAPELVLDAGVFFVMVKRDAPALLTLRAGPFGIQAKGAQLYIKTEDGKIQVMVADGAATVVAKSARHPVATGGAFLGLYDKARGQVKEIPAAPLQKLQKALQSKIPETAPPVLPDRVGPTVTIVSPRDAVPYESGEILVQGLVDDPSVSSVKVDVQGEFRGMEPVQGGQFAFRVKLYDPRNTITVSAEDLARLPGVRSVVVPCTKPLVRPRAAVTEEDKPRGTIEIMVEKLRGAVTDPSNPGVFIAFVVAGGLFIFIIYLIVRKIWSASKKTLNKATELATGVIFQRCEKCSNREYHYHLFYTTETINSPFLRNLINNVNPMATSMMNESLESLLSQGLKFSQKAKQAENKVRVICSWCDFCKTGTLSLEHLQGDAVTKVDDYQIIHPIFIEWVRKVYD